MSEQQKALDIFKQKNCNEDELSNEQPGKSSDKSCCKETSGNEGHSFGLSSLQTSNLTKPQTCGVSAG